MGVHSRITIKLAVAAISVAAVLTVACGDGGDSDVFGAGSAPEQSVYVRTPTPVPSPLPSAPPIAETAPAEPAGDPTPVSLEWLVGNGDVPPLPATFAAPVQDPGLQQAIDTALPGFGGRYSVVVHNLADGRYAARDESRVYYGASLFKAALLYEAYRQRDLGLLNFGMEVELTEEYAEYDLGSLEYLELEAGDTVTIKDAITAMTVISDTPTAVLIQDLIGLESDRTLKDLGLQETQFVNSALPASARDMARLFRAIAAGEGVSEGARLDMLGLLRQEWFVDGIVAGVPEGTAVAHKSGSYQNATHDVAVVWGPAGPYVIAIMTDASYDFTYVRRVARTVWDYFEANP